MTNYTNRAVRNPFSLYIILKNIFYLTDPTIPLLLILLLRMIEGIYLHYIPNNMKYLICIKVFHRHPYYYKVSEQVNKDVISIFIYFGT